MQQLAVRPGAALHSPLACRPAPSGRTHRDMVRLAASGEGGKPIREFREDTGEIVVGGEQQKADKAIYADEVAKAVSARRCGVLRAPVLLGDLASSRGVRVCGGAGRTQARGVLNMLSRLRWPLLAVAGAQEPGQHEQGDEAAAAAGVLWAGRRGEQGVLVCCVCASTGGGRAMERQQHTRTHTTPCTC
jgi:hypothetical protein